MSSVYVYTNTLLYDAFSALLTIFLESLGGHRGRKDRYSSQGLGLGILAELVDDVFGETQPLQLLLQGWLPLWR